MTQGGTLEALTAVRKKVHDFHLSYIHTPNTAVDKAMNEIWNDLNSIIRQLEDYAPFKSGETHCEDCPCRYGIHVRAPGQKGGAA